MPSYIRVLLLLSSVLAADFASRQQTFHSSTIKSTISVAGLCPCAASSRYGVCNMDITVLAER
jgi:hypothetical protein